MYQQDYKVQTGVASLIHLTTDSSEHVNPWCHSTK